MWRPPTAVLAVLALGCASAAAPSSSPPADELSQCRAALGDLRLRLADHELMQVARRREGAFLARAPEPALEPLIARAVAAELARSNVKVVSQALACRTRVCKLTISADQRHPVPDDFPRTLGDRIRFADRYSDYDVDPATGVRLLRSLFYLWLADPSGEPRTVDQLRAQAASPAPVTSAECQAQLAEARTVVERLRAEQDRLRPARSFASEKPSPALTDATAKLLVGAFGLPPQPAGQVVDCRQTICKLLVPVDQDRVRKLRAGVLGPRYDWTVGPGSAPDTDAVYLLWRTEGYGRARQLVEEASRSADAARAKCERLPPGRGGLTVHIELPASDSQGPAPKALISVDGSLAGTPMGRCMVGLLEEKLRASTITGPFARATHPHTFLFPGGR
jgi:hypothetical protein